MDGAQFSRGFHAGEPIADVDAWLRHHLGRRLTVALILPGGVADDTTRRLVDTLTRYSEIRALLQPAGCELGEFLDSLTRVEPEVVLVWTALTMVEDGSAGSQRQVEHALRQLLDALDACGLLDRAFVALIGPHVTREAARRLGFEDGFPARTDVAELATALAHEGVAVDERRRRGSSPPCYL